MDGKKLEGFVSLDIRTARDEITTVLLDMHASAAVDLVGMLELTLQDTDSLNGELGTILGEALSEMDIGRFKGRVPARSPLDMAAVRFLELLIENSGEDEKKN